MRVGPAFALMRRSAHCPAVRRNRKFDWATYTDIRDWFADDELISCPSCGRRTALPTPATGFYVCFDCGLLVPPAGRAAERPAGGETARRSNPEVA